MGEWRWLNEVNAESGIELEEQRRNNTPLREELGRKDAHGTGYAYNKLSTFVLICQARMKNEER
jgi:hypothetical protein